ncbi:hypothetical protein A2U01_0023322, partial [Trifolium medium]|nr:hypothetical protein [Trifolium medium]
MSKFAVAVLSAALIGSTNYCAGRNYSCVFLISGLPAVWGAC